jgi:hypothetical protein
MTLGISLTKALPTGDRVLSKNHSNDLPGVSGHADTAEADHLAQERSESHSVLNAQSVPTFPPGGIDQISSVRCTSMIRFISFAI